LRTKKKAKKKLSATRFKQLQLDEEEKLSGKKWVGKRVKCWWNDPEGWFAGTIIEYKRETSDIEYKVKYDDNTVSWEVVDDGFHFLNKAYEIERQKVIELRKLRRTYKDVNIPKPQTKD